MVDDVASIYELQVQGELDGHWAAWFPGMTTVAAEGTTTLTGPLADQAALHGVLRKIRDLGLIIIGVKRCSGASGHSAMPPAPPGDADPGMG